MQKLRKISAWLLAGALLSPGAAQAAIQPLPFSDIKKHWAKQAIIRGVQQGLFAAGEKIAQFYPERYITRAEFITLLDRLLFHGQEQLFGLTLMSDNDELIRGDGFDEPYLPYSDVDRLTWIYNPMIRVSVVLDRLYGPNSLQSVFAGNEFHPNAPIKREEAARLLQLFTVSATDQNALQQVLAMDWLQKEDDVQVKRGEAAVVADKISQYLDAKQVLPLLDYDGSRFPLVPTIADVFPLFTGYYNLNLSADEKTYIDSVKAISSQQDGDETFVKLKKLADAHFPNQIGVHYYLSWNTGTTLEENLREAFLAIDAYFADKVIKPETMGLLAANVYDIYLQMVQEKDPLADDVRKRLSGYEQRTKEGTEEWQALATYLGALEVKSGQTEQALARYQKFPEKDVALLNAVYYLLHDGKSEQAEKLVQELQQKKQSTERKQLLLVLAHELDTEKKQQEIITDLSFTMRHMDNLPGYKVEGESTQSGFLFKYSQIIDKKQQTSHTTGFYQSSSKLVTDKLEMYDDEKSRLQYFYDFDQQKWSKSSISSNDYIHNWVESKSVAERAKELHAHYLKQSFGSYDVITEWIPGEALTAKSLELSLEKGKLKRVPTFINKYYIDRNSDLMVQQVWRYEEVYESNHYLLNSGKETYSQPSDVRVTIPHNVKEGAGGK